MTRSWGKIPRAVLIGGRRAGRALGFDGAATSSDGGHCGWNGCGAEQLKEFSSIHDFASSCLSASYEGSICQRIIMA